jgi:Spy/CpxP family protein refolding chaperone
MIDKISSNKWQVRGAALIIFILGFTAGALALNGYRSWLRSGGPKPGEDRFERMVKDLNLTEEQKTQVRQIFGDTREKLEGLRKESEPRVKEIRSQADERIQKVLTPEQWQRFQQMRDERGSRRRGRGDGAGPGAER